MPVFRLLWQLRTSGPVPRHPVVLAANHWSMLDPVVLGAVVGPVRYLAVDELWGKSAFFDRFLVGFGAIGMSRTTVPLGAMKEALRTLAAGISVGVFPEGRRVWTRGEAVPRRGAAWLAQQSGVPLVPVAISGTEHAWGRESVFFRRWPVSIAFADPIHPGDYSGDVAGSWAMTEEWERRLDEAMEIAKRA